MIYSSLHLSILTKVELLNYTEGNGNQNMKIRYVKRLQTFRSVFLFVSLEPNKIAIALYDFKKP